MSASRYPRGTAEPIRRIVSPATTRRPSGKQRMSAYCAQYDDTVHSAAKNRKSRLKMWKIRNRRRAAADHLRFASETMLTSCRNSAPWTNERGNRCLRSVVGLMTPSRLKFIRTEK
eukprot:Amastigsp_a508836_23.p5 type:complete len:116 gc:universal Amastigsp_a508836_23:744-397(-)